MPSNRKTVVTRRKLLQTSTAVAAGVMLGGGRLRAAPAADVVETRVISRQPQYYHGWPTVARRKNGRLLLVWSGGREGHVCPFGRVEYMTSDDEGRTWSWPRVLLDSALDDRDAGVLETAKGSLLVTSFSSLDYADLLKNAEKSAPGKGWPAEKLAAWQAVQARLADSERKAELGQWMLRSTDDGRTWSPRYTSIVNSPHGPIQLADGRLLYAGKELWTGQKRTGVCESSDDGQTWRWLAEIPVRKGDSADGYHELHAAEAEGGRVIVQIRNHNQANDGETLQTESTDAGRTWSEPRPIGVWGVPSHLLRLRKGHLLMTYGHRRPPFGNQARLSTDGGKTWSEPMIISGDGPGGDLGYPSTVELADGQFLSAWYELMKGTPKAVLRQARWTLKGG